MTGFAARILVSLFVTLGILAPQGAGLLAALGLDDGRVLVVCTGDGLRTIRIAPDGQPAEISDTADYCALVHAAGTAAVAAPPPAPEHRLRATEPALPRPARIVATAYLPSLPRAPPGA